MTEQTPDQTLSKFFEERNKPLPMPEGSEALFNAIVNMQVTNWLSQLAATAIDIEGVLAAGYLRDIQRQAGLGKRMLREWVDNHMEDELTIDGSRLHFLDAKIDVVLAMADAILDRKSKLVHPKIEKSLQDYYRSM